MSKSSDSGPELIMPSICEESVLEASWRESQMQRRHIRTKNHTSSEGHEIEGKSSPENIPDMNVTANTTWEWPIRTVINLLLIAAISHLLILPELIYHNRSLCTIPMIPSLYPTSCAHPCPRAYLYNHPHRYNHSPHLRTPFDSVLTLQTQLELLFNSTLAEITPYANTLPETESLLHDVQTALKQTQSQSQSGPQHELTLEFDGCRRALTTATRKLDSLKADLRSAVDSLMATGSGSSPPNNHKKKDVVKDARLETQMARREKYLDQLAARMRLRTDSLTGDFAMVADHLESLRGIVERQAALQAAGDGDDGDGGESGVYKNLRTFIDSVVPGWRVPG